MEKTDTKINPSPSSLNYPKEPGVYLMKDRKDKIIYIGKAKNLSHRIKQYFDQSDERAMIPFLVVEIASIDTIILQNETQALLLENTLIKKHQPKYNALLKDDKTFISLHINTEHLWPRIRLVRYKGTPKDKGLYFGPYPQASAARETLDLLSRLFPLRQCSDDELKRRSRPCLLHSIKRCIAPCVSLCSKEEYSLFVESAIRFLRGQDKETVAKLRQEMQRASDHLEFERAASLHRTLQQVELVLSQDSLIAKSAGRDTDVLAVYRQGYHAVLTQLFWREGKLSGAEHYEFNNIIEDESELISSFILQHYNKEFPKEILSSHPLNKSLEEAFYELHHIKIGFHHPLKGDKKILVDLALKNAKTFLQHKVSQREVNEKILLELEEICKLSRYPQKIECFDTSNIGGTGHVACMVGFVDGVRDNKRTRRFHIKKAGAGDDYGAMREILTRRLIKAKENDDLPDLVIVDGGKGQLTVAIEVFKELDIASVDLLALAKESSRHDKGLSQEKIFLPYHKESLVLDKRSPLLFFLQRIRDEAHRSSITFQRQHKKKSTLQSVLDSIKGIGPRKKQRLLTKFGSWQGIQKASNEELAKVPGISQKDIANILMHRESNTKL